MNDLPGDLRHALVSAARLPRLLVTSDFDGTLAPLVNNPADARALPAATRALRALAELPDTPVALISGRSLQVLTELSGAPAGVHLIGSHGAEFDTGFAEDIDTALLATIGTTLEGVAAGHPGAMVEYKPAGVVMHVRNADAAVGAAALDAARAAAVAWPAEMTEGKAILEFAVVTADKGTAVDILRTRENASAVVFFGDDVTDEKAFGRLRDGDIGVKVGPGDSLAAYRVDSPADVAAALVLLAAERAGTPGR